ncbi:MAG TPA: class I SAM-dependent methyltransferase [Aggregatilineaceae bacterium]|nr:class I SAM-dependent methyltransferase [Aggregatilineaceae bacterium]
MASLNERVKAYWEQEPCGTSPELIGTLRPHSWEWFAQIEAYRYQVEPFIHAAAQFTRFHGQRLLEVGVGVGTDHVQWARAGADCYGIDLTDAAIETTREHLTIYGLDSRLERMDAEHLRFDDAFFDVVYSWGVIHHAESPERIVGQIWRVLKPGGQFIGMFYHRRSLLALRLWVKHGLLRGRITRSWADVIAHHMESAGTKAYTVPELKTMFSAYRTCTAVPILTPYDRVKWPGWLSQFFPDRWGWFIVVKAVK